MGSATCSPTASPSGESVCLAVLYVCEMVWWAGGIGRSLHCNFTKLRRCVLTDSVSFRQGEGLWQRDCGRLPACRYFCCNVSNHAPLEPFGAG